MGENESYWYESDAQRKASFSFDDADENVGSSMCGVSLEGTTKLFHELQRDAVNEDHPFLLTDNKYRIPLSKLVSQKSLNKLLESDNESDRTIITHLNIPAEEEVKILRRRIMDRWIAPDINDTISRILLGRPFSLELYKSLEQKKSLLEAAVNLGDGDTILVITLYLLKTLKKSLFNQILMANPVAANHYVNHLATRMQIQELTDLLTMLGRTKDASMKQFEMACRNPQRQIQRLNGCLQNHFIDPTSIDRQHIVKFIKLLEWQQGLKLANKNELSNEEMSVVDCLSYACENYWSEPQRSPCSPFTIAQDHNVNEKLLHWTVLTIRGKLKSWTDIDEFLITEKWLGGRKSKTLLPMDQIVLQLHSLEAPSNILLSYLSLIDNLDDRLKIARTIGCHKAIIDIFVLQKDRLALLNCKAFLTPQTEEFTYAESKLNSSSIKWKN